MTSNSTANSENTIHLIKFTEYMHFWRRVSDEKNRKKILQAGLQFLSQVYILLKEINDESIWAFRVSYYRIKKALWVEMRK